MPPNRNNEHRAAKGWAFIIRILAAVLHAYTQAFTHLFKITRLNRYLRTRQAIINGEKLFCLSGEELKARKLMGPLTLNLYKAALASFPPIAAGWLISWHQQVELNNSGASTQLASSFWMTVLFQWQIVKTLQYTAAAFVVPAVPLVVALLVNWAYLHRVDWKPAIRQRSRRAFLYLDAAYGLLPQMFFSAALVLYVKHNWVSDQVGEDTYYAFNFLMGLPLIVAGLWPGYVFLFQIPRLLFDLNGYGEPEGIISATARLPRPWIQSVFGSAVTMVLVASLVKLALPGYSVPLPPPSGPFAVGRVAYDWIDSTRVETLSSDGPSKSREIMVYVWYPASPPKPGTPAAPYFPDAGKIDQTPFAALEKTIWGSAWPMIATGRVHTRIYENVPVASGDRPFPLIIFSPGFYSEPFGYTHQIEELVSRGYVVATIHHAYEAGVATFPDGRILPFPDDKYWRSSISPFSFESISGKTNGSVRGLRTFFSHSTR